jgi:hypothetical protein
MLEYWNVGILECWVWKNGVMGDWGVGVLGRMILHGCMVYIEGSSFYDL